MNFNELDQFRLSDTVKYHNRLNRRLWGSNEHLLPDVRDKLLAIAEDFREFLGVDNLRVQDITLSGSNAAYNYTDHSDIDLHLIVDMPDDPVYQELFNAKKYQYNDEHNLTIGGADVELYVQPAGQPHVSQGIYSVKDGKWIQVPRRRRAQIDDSCVRDKAADLDARIHAAVESGNADMMSTLWSKIKAMRQIGLEQHGEFGCENITFKVLRDQGCIKLLKDAHLAAQDHAMSLVEKNREKGRVTYGFGNRIAEDVTVTPDGVSASTRMFLSEKGDEDNQAVNDFIQHVVKELGIDPAPKIKLHTDPEWSQGNHSFGRYDPEANTLTVSLIDRHILDIFRTIAHELVHCDQHQKQGGLPLDAGETGSEYENDANARAGIIMRDFAASHPEYFAAESLGEGASGYIPKNKREAAMPQYAMALSVDVHPGQTGREANKMALQTGPNGEPTLLMKNLRNALREFKETGTVLSEQDLFEINMGGKNLRREAAKTGALAGMEFEMIVPNTSSEDDELEPDFDSDERPSSPRDIQDFFYDGDYNGRRNAQELVDRMLDDYGSWQAEQFDTRWDSDTEAFIYHYLKENVDEDSIRELLDLEPEDELGKKEYQLAADMIVTEQLQPFYDDALELSRDEYYENDYFEEWLSDEGLVFMSDIFHRYDGIIHWPHYTSSLAGGTNVKDIADDFSRAVGRPVKASSGYHSSSVERPAPGKNFYVVEPDGSLEPDGPGDSGLEFVSPPLPIDEIVSDLNKVKAWANRMGCYTNDSTGLHINISVPNYSQNRLDFVKLALLMGDEYVLEQFGRAGNSYAKSAMGKVRDHVKQRPFEAKYLLDKMKGHMGALASKAIHSGSTEKYTSINTKDGHIEFRSPGGDWLDDNFDKIENTLMRFTVAMSAALDPEAYRQEYLKKLYKILAPKDEKDPLAVFAKYAAGQLPAAALKSFVRQAQAERKTQKDIKNSKDMSLWKVVGSSNLPTQARGLTVKARTELEAFDQAAKEWNLNPELREKDYYEFNGWTAEKLGVEGQYAIVNRDDPRIRTALGSNDAPDYLFRLSLPPDADQDQMREALQAWASQHGLYMGDYMIVDTTRYQAPAQSAGASATEPHPQGRGRPNDPTGRYAIVRRDDQRNYGNHVGSEAPDYQFRFTLPDGYSQAQMRSVLSAWAARNAVNAEDYMIVDTTQFAAPASAAPEESNQGNWGVWVPSLDRFATTMGNSATRRFLRHGDAQAWIQDYNARNAGNDLELVVREIEPATAQTAAPEAGSVQWNIVADDGDVVHTFWNRNVQADANAAALAWIQANWRPPLNMAARGPFEVVPVPAEVPAYAQTQTYEIYNRADSSPLETFTAAGDIAAMAFLNQYRSMGPHTLNSQQATAAFGVRRAPIPGSTLDLQRQRYNAVAAAAQQQYEIIRGMDTNAIAAAFMAANEQEAIARLERYRREHPGAEYNVQLSSTPDSTQNLPRQRQTSNVTDYTSRAPTPIPGVQDIEIEIPPALPPAQSAPQWEVYRRSDGARMFPLDAATQAEAWAEGREWVQQTSNDTGITLNPADYSVRQAQ